MQRGVAPAHSASSAHPARASWPHGSPSPAIAPHVPGPAHVAQSVKQIRAPHGAAHMFSGSRSHAAPSGAVAHTPRMHAPT